MTWLKIKQVGFAAALLLLTACADANLPKWITGEPTAQEMAYSGPIAMRSEADSGYPNLADVPARPVAITPKAEQVRLLNELKQENAAGQEFLAAYKAKQAPVKKPVVKKKKKKNKKQ